MVWDVQVIDSLGQITHVPWISRVDVDIEVVFDLRGSWIARPSLLEARMTVGILVS